MDFVSLTIEFFANFLSVSIVELISVKAVWRFKYFLRMPIQANIDGGKLQ